MWSWVLSIVGVAGLWFVGRKRWWGWLIAFVNECLWVGYALTTKQYGFILGAVCYMGIHALNTHRWLKEPGGAVNQDVRQSVSLALNDDGVVVQ